MSIGGTTGHPKLVRGAEVIDLPPLPLRGADLSEDWLQEILHRSPAVLPIEEIGSSWGPLVSLGREIELPVGFVDNLYVSPSGDLTLVEAKLWRNPEARRKVVGQILDYAAALTAMSYEDLDQAVRGSDHPVGRGIWSQLCGSAHPPPADSEAAFIDVVSRNLRAGRFLLLVVGDGIRSDLQGLADLLGGHPSLGFHLELVELRTYAMPSAGELLVVPNLVGRTEEVVRAVVEVRSTAADVVITVLPDPSADHDPSRRLGSVDEFVVALASAVGERRAEATRALVEWWEAERSGIVKRNKRSINLSVPYRHTTGKSVSALTLHVTGVAEGSVAPMSEWRGIVAADDALARFEAAGFRGDPLWPKLDLDCTQPDQLDRVQAVLIWADELIRRADTERSSV